MDLLPEKIKRKNFFYELEKRGTKALMYRQIDDEDNYLVGYEVFKIKVDSPKVVFGIQLNEREVFPANEDFGKWAWACSTKEKADQRFQYLESLSEEIQSEEDLEVPSEEGEDE
jgi:hypothetical protein